ncbi:MAG: PQQ-binding-like beta-propeller repeat protein [Bacteroidetes bacterium]|nr:PQQ-binding-like beta-propeller repeat protein [Bacteroidota bacterium]
MKNPKTLNRLLFSLAFCLQVLLLQAQTWQMAYPDIDLTNGEIEPTPDGGFLVPHTAQEGTYFKVDKFGNIEWTVTPPNTYTGQAVEPTIDGNYVIAGQSVTSNQFFLSKITPTGTLLWTKYFTVPNNQANRALLAAIPGGGFYFGANISYLAKLDDDGNVLWEKTTTPYSPTSLVASDDGGAVFVLSFNAVTPGDMGLRKVDGNGDIVWTKNYGSADEVGEAVAKASNGDFVVASTQTVNGNANFFIVKTDADGNAYWEKNIGSNLPESPSAITQTADGGFAVAGFQDDGIYLQYLLRLDAQGDSLWAESYNDGFFYDVKETAAGYLAMFGSQSSFNDIQMVVVNAAGNFDPIFSGALWQRGYAGTDATYSEIVATPDGGFLSSSGGEAVAFKTDPDGHQLWTYELPDSLDTHFGGDVAILPDGNYLVVGGATINSPFHHYIFSAKLNPNGNLVWLKLYPYTGVGTSGHSVAVAADGGIFIGSPYNMLLKTDANGNLLWQLPALNYSVKDLIATADSGAVFLVNDAVVADPILIIRKVNANGGFVWEKSLTSTGNEYVGRSLAPTSDGGFSLTGYLRYGTPSPSENGSDLFMMKFDANGNQLFEQVFPQPDVEVGAEIQQTMDGGYAVTGYKTVPVSRYVWFWRLDPQGNLLWEKNYFKSEGLSLDELSDGGFILLTRGLRLIRTDAQGEVFQNLIQGNVTQDQNGDCNFQSGEPGLDGWQVSAENDFIAVTFTDANGNYEIPVDTGDYVLTFTPPQNTWQPCQANLSTSFTATPATNNLGYLMAQSTTQTTSTISGYVFIDEDGDCVQDANEIGLAGCTVWAATESNFQTPQWTTVTDANGFYSFTLPAGTDYYWIYLPNSSNNPFCQACDNNWLQFLNVTPLTHNIGVQCQPPFAQHLTGFVFYDENENCQPDFGEHGLDGWVLDVVKIGTTDTFQIESANFPGGNFSVPVDTGNYLLTITPPNYLYLPCQFAYTVFVSSLGAPTVYIPLMPLTLCPKLTVDVGTAFLRPCRSSTYYVQYCNEGTGTASDAYVEIAFPPSLTVDSSEITGVALPGNVWQFQLGEIPVDSCGSFWIKAFLKCSDPVGLTYCVDAHIYPDSICGPTNIQWDGSSVELSANCLGDSVVLSITNAGWGDMSEPLNFIVVEDNVLIRDSTFQLPAGGTTQVAVYPNGATIVLSAQQAANHPGMSMPIVFVEGCGQDSISLGFVTQYPQDDADCFIATDCHESVGSFDPNRKSAQPKGVTDAHFIENTTDLNYQINFQNLGTAPAQTVVILDTLSQFLDTARLELGAASHPYSFELLAQNVLKFTFENIQLPAASADYDASIGFLKFRVKQRPGNLPGTVINNQAGIYFDFNAPVITNTVTHRIPLPQMFENQTVSLCAGESWNGQIFTSDTLLTDTLRFAFFDSIFITNLHLQPAISTTLSETLCNGGSLTVNGTVYDESNPSGTEVFIGGSYLGCDSTVFVQLSFNSVVSSEITTTLCAGESLFIGNTIFNEPNPVGEVVFPNGSYLGCDSVVQVNLSFYPVFSSNFTVEICPNESVIVNGTVYDANHLMGTEVMPSSTTGCDSTVYVSLTLLPSPESELDITICDGDSYLFGSEYLAVAGNYTQVLMADNGCDSTVHLALTVLPLSVMEIDTSVLSGTEVFGVLVTADTVFTQTFMDENGCSFRIVTAHLTTDTRQEPEKLQLFSIAPNPSSGNFTIRGQLATGAFCEAKILDAYGRTVVQLFDNEWIAGNFSQKLSLPDLPSGLYFVSFATDGERQVLKLVKE